MYPNFTRQRKAAVLAPGSLVAIHGSKCPSPRILIYNQLQDTMQSLLLPGSTKYEETSLIHLPHPCILVLFLLF